MNPETGVQIYRDFGVAALFITMYLVTIVMFIKDLQKQRKDSQELVVKMITAIEASAIQSLECKEAMESTQLTIENNLRQTGEFIAFLKGRDNRER